MITKHIITLFNEFKFNKLNCANNKENADQTITVPKSTSYKNSTEPLTIKPVTYKPIRYP